MKKNKSHKITVEGHYFESGECFTGVCLLTEDGIFVIEKFNDKKINNKKQI